MGLCCDQVVCCDALVVLWVAWFLVRCLLRCLTNSVAVVVVFLFRLVGLVVCLCVIRVTCICVL